MFIFKTLCIKWKLLWAFVDGANTTRSLERNLLQSFKNVCFAMKCNLPPRLARVWKSKMKVYPFWKHYQLLFSAATLFFLMKNTYEKYIIVSKAIIKKRPNGLGKGKRPKKRVSIPWQTYFRLEYNSETKIRQKLDTRRQKRYFGAQCLKIAKILSFFKDSEWSELPYIWVFSKNQHQNAYFWPKDSSRLNSNAPTKC